MVQRPIIPTGFSSPTDTSGGKRPVVFDILGPDYSTSILPEGMRMVLHVNPQTMQIKYNRQVERIQTLGGWVEQHWGDAINDISFEAATGGFVRMYSGLSNITNPAFGGTRRQTIAYDKYLDMLALFYSNGSVTDQAGTIVLQGIIKVTFDGGVYLGWFNDLTVTDTSEKPYQFTLNSTFTVEREVARWKTSLAPPQATAQRSPRSPAQGQPLLGGED